MQYRVRAVFKENKKGVWREWPVWMRTAIGVMQPEPVVYKAQEEGEGMQGKAGEGMQGKADDAQDKADDAEDDKPVDAEDKADDAEDKENVHVEYLFAKCSLSDAIDKYSSLKPGWKPPKAVQKLLVDVGDPMHLQETVGDPELKASE